jgi:hypothetical protein
VKLHKLRTSELLELGALLVGCFLLVYFSCGGEEASKPRDSKVFSVARSGVPSPGEDEGSSRRRVIEDTLRDLLTGVANGSIREEQRSEIQKSLIALLESVHLGKPENRVNAAAVIVQQVFDQAKLQTPTSELTPRQIQAIQALAKELTRQFMLLAIGSSAGADGIAIPLPAGYERVTWNQLGGFPYQEGGALPAEVMTLRGRRVGLPGFMLSLGDTGDSAEFILVESLWGCCFGSVPDVNQTVIVRMSPGAVMEYSAAPLVVTGVLEVGEERQAGFVTSLYRVTDASVRPLDAAAP